MSLLQLILLATISLVFAIYFGVKIKDMNEQKKNGFKVDAYEYYGTVILWSIPYAFLTISFYEIQGKFLHTDGMSSWVGWIIAGLVGGGLFRVGFYFVLKFYPSSDHTLQG